MKKIIKMSLIMVIALALSSCVRMPVCVTFADNSAMGSGRYIFTVKFEKEEMYKDKNYDIQIKCSIDNAAFKIYEEGEDEKVEVGITKKNEWNSLTTIRKIASSEDNTEDFIIYGEAVNKTFIVESNKKFDMEIRCVVGDKEKNSSQTGYLLTNKIVVSNIFKLKIEGEKSN